jgi:hypothetical protein
MTAQVKRFAPNQWRYLCGDTSADDLAKIAEAWALEIAYLSDPNQMARSPRNGQSDRTAAGTCGANKVLPPADLPASIVHLLLGGPQKPQATGALVVSRRTSAIYGSFASGGVVTGGWRCLVACS